MGNSQTGFQVPGGGCRRSVDGVGGRGSDRELSQWSWPLGEGHVKPGNSPCTGTKVWRTYQGQRRGRGHGEGVGETVWFQKDQGFDRSEEQALGDFSRRGSGQGLGKIIPVAWETERGGGGRES